MPTIIDACVIFSPNFQNGSLWFGVQIDPVTLFTYGIEKINCVVSVEYVIFILIYKSKKYNWK